MYYIVTISTVHYVCTKWNDSKRWKLALLTWVKWVDIRKCVAVSWNAVVGCCRYRVEEVWRSAKSLNYRLSRSGIAVLVPMESHGKHRSKFPTSLSKGCGFVRHPLVRSLSTTIDNSSAATWRTNRHILKFLLFMGVSPNFGWAPPNFGWHPEACLFELFVWSFHVFLVVTHFCRQWRCLKYSKCLIEY